MTEWLVNQAFRRLGCWLSYHSDHRDVNIEMCTWYLILHAANLLIQEWRTTVSGLLLLLVFISFTVAMSCKNKNSQFSNVDLVWQFCIADCTNLHKLGLIFYFDGCCTFLLRKLLLNCKLGLERLLEYQLAIGNCQVILIL